MTKLFKTRTVLVRESGVGDENGWFYSPDDEHPARHTQLRVESDIWADLGRPDVITVTIEPGDKLNAEPAKASL